MDMAESMELISTTDLNSEIEKMFREERDPILILSPYLDISAKIQAILSMFTGKVIYREIGFFKIK